MNKLGLEPFGDTGVLRIDEQSLIIKHQNFTLDTND